jgi:hypothetical protein
MAAVHRDGYGSTRIMTGNAETHVYGRYNVPFARRRVVVIFTRDAAHRFLCDCCVRSPSVGVVLFGVNMRCV